MIPTARNIPPTQPSADFSPTLPPAAPQPFTPDALYPKRGPSNSLYLPLGEWPRLPSTARTFPIPRFIFRGSLVDPRLRASNEHILIVRVPRAGGRPGYPSHPFEAARCASTGIVPATPPD